VQEEARVPVFAHLEGVVHVYVHAPCDLEMARKIVVNAKMRRTGICGAAETLLVDRALAETHLQPLIRALQEANCTVRGDAATQGVATGIDAATDDDWSTEYLMRSSPFGSWTGWKRPSGTSRPTARITPMPS
jgi:glutamate-5-semialdehyde dehydrogenase